MHNSNMKMIYTIMILTMARLVRNRPTPSKGTGIISITEARELSFEGLLRLTSNDLDVNTRKKKSLPMVNNKKKSSKQKDDRDVFNLCDQSGNDYKNQEIPVNFENLIYYHDDDDEDPLFIEEFNLQTTDQFYLCFEDEQIPISFGTVLKSKFRNEKNIENYMFTSNYYREVYKTNSFYFSYDKNKYAEINLIFKEFDRTTPRMRQSDDENNTVGSSNKKTESKGKKNNTKRTKSKVKDDEDSDSDSNSDSEESSDENFMDDMGEDSLNIAKIDLNKSSPVDEDNGFDLNSSNPFESPNNKFTLDPPKKSARKKPQKNTKSRISPNPFENPTSDDNDKGTNDDDEDDDTNPFNDVESDGKKKNTNPFIDDDERRKAKNRKLMLYKIVNEIKSLVEPFPTKHIKPLI